MRKVTLHEEIRDILIANGNVWMATHEIAAQVNLRGRYRKKDGSEMTDYQIHGRTRKRSHLFDREGRLVRCKEQYL